MIRPSFLPMLLVAALACSDTDRPSFIVGPALPEPEPEGFELVTGTVLSMTEIRDNNDGSVRQLLGPQTALLRDLVGAEIRVLGSIDEMGSTSLWIAEFRVLYVDGLPALDGILHPAADGGFEVVTAEGDLTSIGEIPSEMMDYAGKRVWVTMKEGSFFRFGVLEEASYPYDEP